LANFLNQIESLKLAIREILDLGSIKNSETLNKGLKKKIAIKRIWIKFERKQSMNDEIAKKKKNPKMIQNKINSNQKNVNQIEK
jgi:hypothetical protein